jgi:hypothetical protein
LFDAGLQQIGSKPDFTRQPFTRVELALLFNGLPVMAYNADMLF